MTGCSGWELPLRSRALRRQGRGFARAYLRRHRLRSGGRSSRRNRGLLRLLYLLMLLSIPFQVFFEHALASTTLRIEVDSDDVSIDFNAPAGFDRSSRCVYGRYAWAIRPLGVAIANRGEAEVATGVGVHFVAAFSDLAKAGKNCRYFVERDKRVVPGDNDLRWGTRPDGSPWVVHIRPEILGRG
jgi:hypothetical protein